MIPISFGHWPLKISFLTAFSFLNVENVKCMLVNPPKLLSENFDVFPSLILTLNSTSTMEKENRQKFFFRDSLRCFETENFF